MQTEAAGKQGVEPVCNTRKDKNRKHMSRSSKEDSVQAASRAALVFNKITHNKTQSLSRWFNICLVARQKPVIQRSAGT